MDPIESFQKERTERIKSYRNKQGFKDRSRQWLEESMREQYVYNFDWAGRPIIQNPVDIMAMQEIILAVKPDLIVETGIAHGGSIIFSASMLALLDMHDAIDAGRSIDPGVSGRKVLGIDIDIRAHNRAAIEAHPMSSRIQMLQGSSIAPEIVSQVNDIAKSYDRVLVCLDSNHTHAHVLAELNAYAPLVTKGSYCVVFDTFVEDVPKDTFADRPWEPGNNPKTAVWEYLKSNPDFAIDSSIEDKLLITVAPDGYLKRTT